MPYPILYIKSMQIIVKKYHSHWHLVSYCLLIKFVWLEVGHNKMILCLAAMYTSIFTTLCQAFFLIKSVHEAFHVPFINFYHQTYLATFYLILLNLSYLVLTVFLHEFNFHLSVCFFVRFCCYLFLAYQSNH